MFRIRGLRTDGTPRLVGQGEEHVQVTFRSDSGRIPAIWFRAAGRARELTAGGELTLLAHVGVNHFRGRNLQLQIIDILPTSERPDWSHTHTAVHFSDTNCHIVWRRALPIDLR